MKKVTLLAKVNKDKCIGCKICTKVCPVQAISINDKKAFVDSDKCRACANCEQRCPQNAINMIKRDVPLEIGIDVSKYDQKEIRNICEKAHLNPEQIICYCVGTRAEEVVAAILAGATTPELISSMTGVRTGCTIECIQPLLRLIEASGNKLNPSKDGWQWYGTTPTAWTINQSIVEKYSNRGFYFEEDKQLLNTIVYAKTYTSEGGKE
jgi:Fe-S-cluster-containing hydrogenase component 2